MVCMCSQKKASNIPSAYLSAHPRHKTCLKGWKQQQQQSCRFCCDGEARNAVALCSHSTFEKSSKSILWQARSYGSEGISFFPGNASSKYSQVIGDSQISWPLLVSRTGTSPAGFFSKNQSGLFFRLMLITSWLKEQKKQDADMLSSAPVHPTPWWNTVTPTVQYLRGSTLKPCTPIFFEVVCRTNPLTQNYCHTSLEKASTDLKWVVCRLYACLLLV